MELYLKKQGEQNMNNKQSTEKKIAKQDNKSDTFMDLRKAAKPLIELLSNKYHPHITAIVTRNSLELLEGIMFDYVLDEKKKE